ncbi:MAG: tyrosine-protein phosphatase [Peptococcaceae bacterium]
MHCTGGKDRTGAGVAIVLPALDVPEQTVREDDILSQEYGEFVNQKVIKTMQSRSYLDTDYKYEVFKSVLAACPEYLEEAFREMRKQYGLIDAYLEMRLGLTEQRKDILKQLLLEDSDDMR